MGAATDGSVVAARKSTVTTWRDKVVMPYTQLNRTTSIEEKELTILTLHLFKHINITHKPKNIELIISTRLVALTREQNRTE